MPSSSVARVIVSVSLAFVVGVVAALLLFSGSSDLTLHARFANAGQLVKGADVRLAGRRVGSVREITLTDDGQADVRFDVSDGAVLLLRRGTHATIRLLGQASVAGRVLELTPSQRGGPVLRDGAVLSEQETTGIVDLDAVLDALEPPARADVRRLLANSAAIYAGSGARSFNRLLETGNPAVAQFRGLTQDFSDDRASLGRVLRASAAVTGALAVRRDDVRGAVDATARTVVTLADERRSLAATLTAAPASLARLGTTLRGLQQTATVLRPTLRRAVPATRSLRTVLKVGGPALQQTAPVLEQAAALTPSTARALRILARVSPPLTETFAATAPTLRRALPIVRGLRFYGADAILGLFNGLAGNATGNYDTLGHYFRLTFMVAPQQILSGAGSSLLPNLDLGAFKVRTGLTSRCPGGSAAPAPDGSNPWIPDPSLCDPEHDVPASVNKP